MRKIKPIQIKEKVKKLFLKSNYHIDTAFMKLLQLALKEETLPLGKHVLQMIIDNNKIASREKIAICQDYWISCPLYRIRARSPNNW